MRNIKSKLETFANTLAPVKESVKETDDFQSVVSELTSNKRENMGKVMRLLTSSIKLIRKVRSDIRNVTRILADSPVNATVDRGADTFLLGSSFRIFEYTDKKANIVSFDDSMHVDTLPVGSGVTAYDLPDGTCVLLMVHEGIDYTSQPNSIFSVSQARYHGVDICDRHPKFLVNGKPGLFRMKLNEYEIPFTMENGLVSITIRKPTDDEINSCPILELTSDAPWNPSALSGDNFIPNADSSLVFREPSEDPTYTILISRRYNRDFTAPLYEPVYENLDFYVLCHVDSSIAQGPPLDSVTTIYEMEDTIDQLSRNYMLNRRDQQPDLDHAQRCMGWFPKDVIAKTLDATTQNAKVSALPYRDHFKARNPVMNRRRLHETYATDTWFASEPALNGETCVQLFVGLTSFLVFAFGMKSESQGPSCSSSWCPLCSDQ